MIATIFFNLTIFSFLANKFFLIFWETFAKFFISQKLEYSQSPPWLHHFLIKLVPLAFFIKNKIEVFSKVSIVRSEEKEKTIKIVLLQNIWFKVS
jgi:hypothetical protein